MPINSKHPLYVKNIDRWERCRDAYMGQDAIKAKGVRYLPKIDPTQTEDLYESYKNRAMYYGAVGRTIDGFIGAITRKPHTIDLPAGMEDFEAAACIDGTSLDEFIKKLGAETTLQGRGGILVDYNEKAKRPYLALYCTESIHNWGEDSVVLGETVYEPAKNDRYKQVAVEQLREICLVEGIYTVNVWRPNPEKKDEWLVDSTVTPTIRGKQMDALPWFEFSSMGQSASISKPPMLDLVDVSISHYQSTADLEHGCHWTASPTLYVTGVNDDSDIVVGGGSVIKLSDPNAKAGYAEFRGEGLGTLERRLESKEKQMAMLGAAIFAGGKKGVEAAETARIRTAGETSLLMGVVSAIEETLLPALKVAAEWLMTAPGTIVLKINRDFIDQQLDPQTILGLVQAFQAGMMSIEIFLFCLDQAEMLPPETDISALAAKLKAEGPPAALKPKTPAAPAADPNGVGNK